ncbi:MAG: flagellar hook-associated protein FlgK [Devosia sp.]|uniref:flagellar hook-associated protein FlgK n=1 Tax=Devosia sp. 66-22 TaxID=1895753 RepID=UPI000B1E9F9E|nr:flagellar hook-associated protein FlgK [Devosia sp. 66-22]MBN9346586.1 flagellar hook-associated protein FlgK [Devosia sp.]
MSLSSSLSNALSGMRVGQNSLEVLSRNVSNSGTPGYHKQSLSVIDTVAGASSYARSGTVERAFNKSLQVYYTNAVSDTAYSGTRAASLDRLQAFLGMPGKAGSLDTMFGNLQNAFQALSTSPDNYASRATVVTQAQAMATTLNSLTRDVQSLRQEAENEMAATVDRLNLAVTSLKSVNDKLGDLSSDNATRATLMDQRDRLVSEIAELMDVRVDYRSDDTVALMTRSGVGILDGSAARFNFTPAGALSADKQFSADPAKNSVGRLTLSTASGSTIDLVQQRVLQSGKLGALVELRDETLVAAQGQLDEIAAGLAQAMSTVKTAGTAASSGTQNGYTLDLSGVRTGNDFVLSYKSGGVDKAVRVVNVGDPSKLPLDYVDATGARVVGMDFSAGSAAVAAGLQGVLGSGLTVSASGNSLTVLDDGATNATDVNALTARTTATALQNGDAALNLFVDTNNADFTNSLDGKTQKLGFAGRIAVNASVLIDNTLLVKATPTSSLGDPSRVDYLLDQLQNATFASSQTGPASAGSFRLSGSVGDLIAQTMNYTGSLSELATSDASTQQMAMDSLDERMQSEYGVNVDEEMARLIELQNAYAANSRVIAAVQELMNRLMEL